MISRMPILSSLPVTGQYKFSELLQIIPPISSDPRPDMLHGWYGATLAVRFDESGAHHRQADWWAYDYRERQRIDFLKTQVERGVGSGDWLRTATQIQTNSFRRRAVENEALRLLQVLTNNTFRQPRVDHN
jgi:hypothetical protein